MIHICDTCYHSHHPGSRSWAGQLGWCQRGQHGTLYLGRGQDDQDSTATSLEADQTRKKLLWWRIKSKVGYLWSSGEHFMSKSQLFLQFQLNLNIILHLEIILLKYSSNKYKILVKAVSRKFFRMMCSNIYVNNSVVIQSLWFDILLRKVDNSLQNFVISKIVVFKLYENHNPSMQLCLTGIMRVEDRHYLHQDIYKRHCIW